MQETHNITVYLNQNGKYSVEVKSDFHDKYSDQLKNKSFQTYGIEEDSIENAINKSQTVIEQHKKEK